MCEAAPDKNSGFLPCLEYREPRRIAGLARVPES